MLHLFIPIDRASKRALARLVGRANTGTAVAFREALLATAPHPIHTVLTDNSIPSAGHARPTASSII